jgi:opacity protein-like surface antigen
MLPTSPRFLSLLVGCALLSATPASAQDWSQPWADPQDRPPRVDVSASIGFLAPTDWSDLVLLGSISSSSGILEQVLVGDLRVEPDREFGGAVHYWRGRYGFRVEGGFSSSSVRGDERLSVDVDTWLYNFGGAIGFLEYAPDRWVWPYAFVGVGGVTYDLARRIAPPLTTFIERSPPRADGRRDLVIVDDDSSEFLLAVDELDTETVFALNFGVGTDLRIPLGPAGVGLRLELADHVTSSPVGLRVGALRRSGALTSDTGVEFGPVHHFRASAGFVLQFGR